MKTLLITGINGFLGSHLAKTLSDAFKIVGLARSINGLSRLGDHSFKIYSSKDDLKAIFEENDIYAIVHAATVYRRGTDPRENIISTNILLPVKLYEMAHQFNVSLFLNTDSFINNEKYREYRYLLDYALSKKHVLAWLKLVEGPCKLVNMEIFHMYGPNDSQDKFIPQMISTLRNNVPHVDATLGEHTRDFIHVADVVSAYRAVLQSGDMCMEAFTEFEVGTGTETSIRDMILLIKKLTGSTSQIEFGSLDYRQNEIMESKSDNRALKALGWKPIYDVNEGLADTIA